jgi:hypothetical protein
MTISTKAAAAALSIALAAGLAAAPAQAAFLYEGELGYAPVDLDGTFSFTLDSLGVAPFSVDPAGPGVTCAFTLADVATPCIGIYFLAQNQPYPQGPGINLGVSTGPGASMTLPGVSISGLGVGAHELTGFEGEHVGQLTITDLSVTPPSGAPEPAAWALMLAGLGLAGAALRRRVATA